MSGVQGCWLAGTGLKAGAFQSVDAAARS